MRRFAIITLFAGSLLTVIWTTFGGFTFRNTTLTQTVARLVIDDATPILTAIQKYESMTGHPPASLSVLIPRFLPALPTPRYASGRDYLYWVEPNQWRLAVPMQGEKNAVLTYSSIRDYPAGSSKIQVERIGDWAYFHGNPYTP